MPRDTTTVRTTKAANEAAARIAQRSALPVDVVVADAGRRSDTVVVIAMACCLRLPNAGHVDVATLGGSQRGGILRPIHSDRDRRTISGGWHQSSVRSHGSAPGRAWHAGTCAVNVATLPGQWADVRLSDEPQRLRHPLVGRQNWSRAG